MTGADDNGSAPRVAIFGSCVTRDLFEDATLRPTLTLYAARCSMISVTAPRVAIDERVIDLSSPWQRRCVVADFEKTFFDALAEAAPDWLIVDLVDERFNLLRTAGSLVTESSAFQAAGLRSARGYAFEPVRRASPEGRELFGEAATRFIERASEIVPRERIVVHRALWLTRFREGDALHPFPEPRRQLAEAQNAMLGDAYDRLAERLGERAPVLALDCAAYAADADHRWKLEPFHYEPAYNEAAIGRLQTLLGIR